jgi:hypothetical protein
MQRVPFAVWVLEFSYLEKGGDAANPDDWYEVLEGIYWTRTGALAYLRDDYYGVEKFQELEWWYPFPHNLNYMQCGLPWEEHAGLVLHKALIE